MDRRETLREVFKDTQQFYREEPILAAAVEQSRTQTKLYEANDYPLIPQSRACNGLVRVSQSKTFEAAMRLKKAHPTQKIGVLNFAAATRPGGGVKNGSSAQEESLCRCSTLYPTLDQKWLWENYYCLLYTSPRPRH